MNKRMNKVNLRIILKEKKTTALFLNGNRVQSIHQTTRLLVNVLFPHLNYTVQVLVWTVDGISFNWMHFFLSTVDMYRDPQIIHSTGQLLIRRLESWILYKPHADIRRTSYYLECLSLTSPVFTSCSSVTRDTTWVPVGKRDSKKPGLHSISACNWWEKNILPLLPFVTYVKTFWKVENVFCIILPSQKKRMPWWTVCINKGALWKGFCKGAFWVSVGPQRTPLSQHSKQHTSKGLCVQFTHLIQPIFYSFQIKLEVLIILHRNVKML